MDRGAPARATTEQAPAPGLRPAVSEDGLAPQASQLAEPTPAHTEHAPSAPGLPAILQADPPAARGADAAASSTGTGVSIASRPGAQASLSQPAQAVAPESPEAPETKKTESASRGTRAELPPQEDASLERASSVLRQIRLQLHPGVRAATLSLAPAELGRLSIRLSMEDDSLRAVVRAEEPETLRILEKHLPELRAALEQQGIEAGEFDLDLASDAFPERGQEPDPRGPRTVEALAPSDEGDRRIHRMLASSAGVDTYA